MAADAHDVGLDGWERRSRTAADAHDAGPESWEGGLGKEKQTPMLMMLPGELGKEKQTAADADGR